MICPSCGSANLAGAAVCANCGATLNPPMTETAPQQAASAQAFTPPPAGYAPPATPAPIPITPPPAAPAPSFAPPPPGYAAPVAPMSGYTPPPPGYVAQPSMPAYPPGYAPPPVGYASPSTPMYAPPSTPMYPPGYAPPPAGYAPPPAGYVPPPAGYAPPSAPMYPPGYAPPPSTPMYAPPSTPMYAPPSAGYAPPAGAAPNPLTAAAPIFSRLFGDDANPAGVQPATRLQALLYRNVSPALAVNRWFTAAAGAIVAMLVGLALTAIAENMWTTLLKGALSSLSNNQYASVLSSMTSSLLTPSLLLLFAIEQHAPLTMSVSGSGSGVSASADASLTFPLTGLFLLPAIALTVGGFISAASDYAHTARFSILRGALIGPMYAVLLFVLSFFTSSSSSGGALGVDVSITLGTNGFEEALYGLLWGALFGALGGWISFASWSFLEWGMPVLRSVRLKRVAAAFAGAGVAYMTGVLLSIALLAAGAGSLRVWTAGNIPLSGFSALSQVQSLSGPSNSSGVQGLGLALMYIFVLAPMMPMWLFTLASGSSLDVSTSATGASASQSSYSLFGATVNNVTTHPTLPGWIYLALLIPLIAWIAGGITAARVADARTPGDGFIAGLLAAVPFSVIFALFATWSGVSFDAQAAGLFSASGMAGPPFWGALLATLIGSAIVGGVGGAMSTTASWVSAIPLWLVTPFRIFQPVVYPLLDWLTGHRGGPRGAARMMLYAAALLTVAAIVIVIACDLLSALLLQAMPYSTAITLLAYVVAAAIFLPLAYLTGSLVCAFTSPSGAGMMPPPAPTGYASPAYAPPPGGFAPQYAPAPGVAPTPVYAPPPNTNPTPPAYAPPNTNPPPTPWPSQDS